MSYPALDAPLAKGEVALVGAGPGEPGLLTLAAAALIGDCDAIVYDALVSDAVLAMADEKAEKHCVGKRGGMASTSQQEICALLLALAGSGKRVVRLKGGDPFVFGRGSVEVQALAARGMRFRIVPGITAGVAAPAMAGIPVTDHAVNEAVAFLTGHNLVGNERLDWQALVRAFPVLVFYMATRNLDAIAARLLAAGLPEQTPLAVIRSASLPDETVVEATLQQAAAGTVDAVSPSIIIIGDVVAARLPWRFAEQEQGGELP